MPMPSPLRALAAALLLLSGAAWSQMFEAVPQNLPTTPLRAGIHHIRAQLATSSEQHTIGLMHRRKMPTNDGMLFVFPAPAQQCFWMKNTLLPLSIAFIQDDGTVVNIDEMQPQTLNPHCSEKPVRYVLEMNTGWFSKRGIKAGAKIEGDVFAKR